MVSGCVAVFCHVEVVAIIASRSIWLEYNKSRTSDIWSSGSFPISLIMTARGVPENASTAGEATASPCAKRHVEVLTHPATNRSIHPARLELGCIENRITGHQPDR